MSSKLMITLCVLYAAACLLLLYRAEQNNRQIKEEMFAPRKPLPASSPVNHSYYVNLSQPEVSPQPPKVKEEYPGLDRFFYALKRCETGLITHDFPDGDNGASIGPFQIQEAYFLDSGVSGLYEYCQDTEFAKEVILAYMKRYAKEDLKNGNWVKLARIHNGGPRGHLKNATLPYAKKFRKYLKEYDND